jgi:hypothetical protein
VILKLAVSADWKIASGEGERTRITGPEANARVHLLRAQCDAILVGMETVLVDDPELTCRVTNAGTGTQLNSALPGTGKNAITTGRLAQAFIFAGPRGVGKTTTARILARALNYELPDGSVTGPTIKMPKLGVHCQAIIESRHIDVLEMDAASHNGVDDVRQINDAIRYAPVSART